MEDPEKSSPKVWQSLLPAVIQKKKKLKRESFFIQLKIDNPFTPAIILKNGIKQTTDFLNIKIDNS